jgi:hypothetical protein
VPKLSLAASLLITLSAATTWAATCESLAFAQLARYHCHFGDNGSGRSACSLQTRPGELGFTGILPRRADDSADQRFRYPNGNLAPGRQLE